jgi:HlyD family secretion protein
MAAKKSNKRRRIIVFTVILLGLAGLGAAAYFNRKESPIVVQTEKASRRSVTETVPGTGKLQAVLKVVINPEESGEIIALPVKEGQTVKKGDLLVKIRPDPYVAARSQADANYKSTQAAGLQAKAQLEKSQIEFKRNQELYKERLIADTTMVDFRTQLEVAKLQYESQLHQTDMAKAALDKADDDLSKTTIVSPIDGVVTQKKSQVGERVVGTAMMAGTEILTVADLTDMEALVDIGETDVNLIKLGQKAKLEVDSFKDKKFNGEVTEIANSANTTAAGTQQEATKFAVKIHLTEKGAFRPGMSVTAEVETRSQMKVITVPIQCVTTRVPGSPGEKAGASGAPAPDQGNGDPAAPDKKPANAPKPVEVVFVVENGRVKMQKVTRGISDDNYTEITEGLKEGQEVVSGGFKAINHELEEGKLVKVDNTKKMPAVIEAGAP